MPIEVGDLEGDRRAEGEPTANAGDDVRGVLLDLLATAPTMATLPASQIQNQIFFAKRQARRNAVEDDGQPLAMRLARREEAQRHTATAPTAAFNAARMTSSGAGWPVQTWKDAAPWWRSMARPSGDRPARRSNTRC